MNKLIHWLFAILFFGAVAIMEAQQPAKIPRIGLVPVAGNPKTPGFSSKHSGKFDLVINKTAKQIGLTIPPNVLARANKIIR